MSQRYPSASHRAVNPCGHTAHSPSERRRRFVPGSLADGPYGAGACVGSIVWSPEPLVTVPSSQDPRRPPPHVTRGCSCSELPLFFCQKYHSPCITKKKPQNKIQTHISCDLKLNKPASPGFTLCFSGAEEVNWKSRGYVTIMETISPCSDTNRGVYNPPFCMCC